MDAVFEIYGFGGIGNLMRVLIIDDHPLFRQGICACLQQIDIECQFDEAETWHLAEPILQSSERPDLVLLDLKLPDINGVDALQILRNSYPILPVVILSASDDPAIMRKTLDMGAHGFLPKSSSNEVIIKAIQLVLAGGIYVPPEALSTVRPIAAGRADPPDGNFSITARQAEVMHLVAQGQPNKVIAHLLGLSENTVRGHVSALLKILGVSNRTEAAYAILNAQKKGEE